MRNQNLCSKSSNTDVRMAAKRRGIHLSDKRDDTLCELCGRSCDRLGGRDGMRTGSIQTPLSPYPYPDPLRQSTMARV